MHTGEMNLDDWLRKHVDWMVQETSQYFDTRELLSLCQTVAIMSLNQTLRSLAAGQDLGQVKEAILAAQERQTAGLRELLTNKAKPKPAKK